MKKPLNTIPKIESEEMLLNIQSNNYPSLLIDESHQFWLMTNTRKELKMTPLCKALYLLFLKHPAGISLYELYNHQSELFDLYKKISRKHDYTAMRTSIAQLVNRCDNSIHEKTARIKALFKHHLPPAIAHLYYIRGKRGEEKSISLPRDLVVYAQSV